MSGVDQPHFKRNPFPGNQRFGCPMCPTTQIKYCEALDATSVISYFENHPECLDEIILSLSTKKIQWLLQKRQSHITDDIIFEPPPIRKHVIPNPLSSIKMQSEAFLRESKEPDLNKLLFRTADVLARTLNVNWFSLYLPCNKNNHLCEYSIEGNKWQYGPICKGTTVSAEAAYLGSTLLIENLPNNSKFPMGVGHPDRDVYSVLSVPLIFPSGDLIGVIELCKDGLTEPFSKDDLQIINSLLGWMISSLHQASINRIIILESKLIDCLLDATKEQVSENVVSIDKLVEKILLFSKDLVHADRCSMYLVNEEENEMYADYFYEGLSEDGKETFSTQKQISFSCDTGIVGHVYKTGEAINVFDAYRDPHFNADLDEVTGYKTKNTLAYPIKLKTKVVGVIQLVNSLSNDHFTRADENAIKTYAVYCALALHNSRIFNQLHQSKKQNKIAMEVLQFHIVADEHESRGLKEDTPPEMIPDEFISFNMQTCQYENSLPQLFIHMIHDLVGKDRFEFSKLSRFILTVRKNYRPVAYHNWNHGFKVTHSLYCMFKTNPNIFTSNEATAMVIAGICHDLDHRGFNNVFYQTCNLPLADLYSTSVMEQHHYKQAITILQLEGHDIFSSFSSYEYKQIIEEIHFAIIATDLSLYFGRKKNLSHMLNTNTFNIKKKECRELCKGLMMTGADLCAVALPWESQQLVVECIYDEFYTQGDAEKKKGFQPIEIMDRDFEEDKPKQQVGFILFICKPLYSTIRDVLPGCQPLFDGTESNLINWQRVASEKHKNGEETTTQNEERKTEEKKREENEPKEKEKEDNEPKEKVENEPKDKENEDNEPKEKEKEDNEPKEKENEDNEPKEKEKEDNEPKENEDNEPKEKEKEDNEPKEKEKEDNEPKEKENEDNEPQEKEKEDNEPKEKEKVDNEPKEKEKEENEPKEKEGKKKD